MFCSYSCEFIHDKFHKDITTSRVLIVKIKIYDILLLHSVGTKFSSPAMMAVKGKSDISVEYRSSVGRLSAESVDITADCRSNIDRL